jgi:anti-sigma B factor antagonist
MAVQTHLPNVPADRLQIVVSERGPTTTVALHGEWDLATQVAARQAIGRALARRPETLVLDLSRLSFIDSSGIHAVISLVRRTERLNLRLRIVPGPRSVQRILEICHLTERMPFVNDA